MPVVFKEMKHEYPNYGKSQNIDYEDWWSELIQRLYSPTKLHNDFITDLMNLFSSDLGYSGYNDVSEFLETYSKRPDILFIASSNGDPRVIKVLESLNLLHHFHKVYLSYDIEFSKPSEEFFHYIINDLLHDSELLVGIRSDLLVNSWHIGDEIGNDLNGPVESGWNSILVDRKNEYQTILSKIAQFDDESEIAKIKLNTDFTNTTSNLIDDETPLKLDNKRSVVKNFSQVASVIGL